MNRILLTLLAAALVGGMAFSQAFPDIPVDHWAGDAVQEIADLGIVIGFPDGTFRGNEAFTRYQAALVISRLLAVIDANMEAELAGLRAAMQDLAADLAAQGARLAAVESAVAGLTDDVAVDAARIAALEDALAALEAEMADPAAIRDLQNQIESLRVAVDTAQAQAEAAAARADDAFDLASQALDAAGMTAAALEDVRSLAQAADARAAEAATIATAAAAAADAAAAQAGAAAAAADAAAAQAAGAAAAAGDAIAAADMAAARADAAATRADSAYDLALQALAVGDANAADIAALNRAVQILADRVDELVGIPMPEIPEVDLTGILGDIERITGDIANIREFVILLRRDQVALRDRVAALEAADARTAEALADLDARVAQLERTALQISGNIAISYNVIRFAGCPALDPTCAFDIDRVYGIGFPRDMGRSVLSTGADADFPAQRRREFTAGVGFASTLTLNVIGGEAFDAVSHPRGLDAFGAVVELDFRRAVNLEATDGTIFQGYVLRVASITTTFDPVGMEPLSFRFGEDITVRATPYVFDIEEEVGFVARIGAPDFLAFLSPTLWVAYTDPADDGTTNRSAIRVTLAPSLGDAAHFQLGGTFAREAFNTLDQDDVLEDNIETWVWSVDGEARLLGVVGLEFEYANNLGLEEGVDPSSVLYVRGTIDGTGLPIINSLAANFRQLDPDFYGIWTDPAETAEDFPFALDQTGFGVEGSLGLFILDVTAFFDNYTVTVPDEATVTAFGVEGTADLFAGFSLGAFFESVAIDGTVVDETGVYTRENLGYILMDGEYETQFGVRFVHDGDAANALIRNLDIEVEYRRFNAEFDGSDLNVSVAYDLDIAFVALQPYVSYQMFDDPDVSQFTELRAGTSLQTSTFDFGIVRPGLMAAVNYRTTAYAAVPAPVEAFTATELQWSVGLVLDAFLFGEYSTLTGRYGQYVGTNVNTFAPVPTANPVPGVGRTWDTDLGGATTTTAGYEVQWNYYDLVFAYGVYETSFDGQARSAQQFRVNYRVNF